MAKKNKSMKVSAKSEKKLDTKKIAEKGFKNVDGYKSKGRSFWDIISRKK
ncbi:MAG TPA: hypothetical protein VLH40_05625 [Atribacteraceae bacterium]|nr:hypothetical protein [Atribacteraceae bacterium]